MHYPDIPPHECDTLNDLCDWHRLLCRRALRCGENATSNRYLILAGNYLAALRTRLAVARAEYTHAVSEVTNTGGPDHESQRHAADHLAACHRGLSAAIAEYRDALGKLSVDEQPLTRIKVLRSIEPARADETGPDEQPEEQPRNQPEEPTADHGVFVVEVPPNDETAALDVAAVCPFASCPWIASFKW
jgi:hypothetical protein